MLPPEAPTYIVEHEEHLALSLRSRGQRPDPTQARAIGERSAGESSGALREEGSRRASNTESGACKYHLGLYVLMMICLVRESRSKIVGDGFINVALRFQVGRLDRGAGQSSPCLRGTVYGIMIRRLAGKLTADAGFSATEAVRLGNKRCGCLRSRR